MSREHWKPEPRTRTRNSLCSSRPRSACTTAWSMVCERRLLRARKPTAPVPPRSRSTATVTEGSSRAYDKGALPLQLPSLLHRTSLHHHPELVGLDRPVHRLFLGNESPLVEREEALVQRLHRVLLLADLHLRVNLVDLVLADEVSDRRIGDEHLEREHASGRAVPREELLRDNALENERQLRADLRLLVRREDVDDAVDRRDGAVRVERREDEVPRLADGERRLDGLEVAHLADEDDVRVLPEDVFERVLEPRRVRPHLSLVDDGQLVRVQILDRVFDRDDVEPLLGVDLVDDRRERRRLSRSRRARDE